MMQRWRCRFSLLRYGSETAAHTFPKHALIVLTYTHDLALAHQPPRRALPLAMQPRRTVHEIAVQRDRVLDDGLLKLSRTGQFRGLVKGLTSQRYHSRP